MSEQGADIGHCAAIDTVHSAGCSRAFKAGQSGVGTTEWTPSLVAMHQCCHEHVSRSGGFCPCFYPVT
jgi:hypothetical protein